MTLDQLIKRRDALILETKDPEFSRDARENTGRDDVLRDLRLVNEQIDALEREALNKDSDSIVGTISTDVPYIITYIRIVANGIDLRVPDKFVGTLVSGTVNNKGSLFEEQENIRPISDRSPIGKALKNKLPGVFRVPTPSGYVELEVSSL